MLKAYYDPKNAGSYGGLQLAVKNNGGGRPLNIKNLFNSPLYLFNASFFVSMASNTESDDGALGRRGHYQFQLQQFRERNARRYGIRRTSYHVRVQNPPEEFPEGHGNIVRAFEEGLADVIEDLTESMPDHDRIQIYLSSNRLQSAHTSADVTVGDWRDPLSGARRILHQISKMLNSNENFEVDDSLQLDVTHITMPKPASPQDSYGYKQHIPYGSHQS